MASTQSNRNRQTNRKRSSSNSKTRRGRIANDEGNEELWKGLVAGLAAGAAASLVMNLFQLGMKMVEGAVKETPEHRDRYPGAAKEGGQQAEKAPSSSEEEGENATVKVAEEISETVFDHSLSPSEKQTLGPVVHYAFGASVGALYGGIAEYQPSVTTAYGLIYGAAVWAAADETVLPLLGITKTPDKYPPEVHLKALSAHLVYGVTLELTRRLARGLLDKA